MLTNGQRYIMKALKYSLFEIPFVIEDGGC